MVLRIGLTALRIVLGGTATLCLVVTASFVHSAVFVRLPALAELTPESGMVDRTRIRRDRVSETFAFGVKDGGAYGYRQGRPAYDHLVARAQPGASVRVLRWTETDPYSSTVQVEVDGELVVSYEDARRWDARARRSALAIGAFLGAVGLGAAALLVITLRWWPTQFQRSAPPSGAG